MVIVSPRIHGAVLNAYSICAHKVRVFSTRVNIQLIPNMLFIRFGPRLRLNSKYAPSKPPGAVPKGKLGGSPV